MLALLALAALPASFIVGGPTLARTLTVAAVPAPPATPAVDWQRIEAQAVADLQAYLRIDTTNPPGNEARAAELLATRLRELGLSVQTFEVAPGRPNLVAVRKGDGSKRPLILTNHMDVVEADAATWTHGPFSGDLADGAIWGRGALDMKGTAVAQLAVLAALAAEGKTLRRDVIFLALADEEDGSIGAAWLQKHPEVLGGAELALNEGASIETTDTPERRVLRWSVSPMEKSVLWLRATVLGEAGHGSMPSPSSAVHRLVTALARVAATQSPIVLLPSVEAYFAATADSQPKSLQPKLRGLRRYMGDPRVLSELTADPFHNALLRNTVSVTSLSAGHKVNVIPGRAEAQLDCRLLPGQSKDTFLKWLRATLGDPGVQLDESLWFATRESPVETELMRAIRAVAARRNPGVPVVPLPLVATTDSSVLRALGVVTYGFEPFPVGKDEQARQHGADERIRVASFTEGIRILYDLVRELGQ